MSTGDRIDEVTAGADAAAKKVTNLTESIGDFIATGQKASDRLVRMSTAYKDMQEVLEKASSATNGLAKAIAGMTDKIPVIGGFASQAIKAVGGISKAMLSLGKVLVDIPAKFVTALDDQTRGIRAFDKEIFDLNKRFTGTIEEAQQFADSLRLAGENDLAKSLYMTTNEMKEFVAATRSTQLTQEQLSQVVQTGAGTIELYGAATAFAASSNMSANDAAQIFNTLMNKQGKSAQEATNMLGLYIGVAEETGLTIDKVSSSLNSAVANFAKIGMAADFGAPVLKGFASTMSDMGLGIEEAVGLSNELTGSLASLTNNYSMAYLTFQRGGLEIGGSGGGGVLSSSIALQAAYLDAEETGDQAAISSQLVTGMKDTLASLTGGDIVTVQQANEDPSMANQFYVQQQLLKSNFGIRDDNSAARVLDMLSKLDEATRTGDVESQKKLAEQIKRESEGRDKTLDVMEKVNRNLESQINLMTVQIRAQLDQTRIMAESAGRGISQTIVPGAVASAEAAIGAQAAVLNKIQGFIDSGDGFTAENRNEVNRMMGIPNDGFVSASFANLEMARSLDGRGEAVTPTDEQLERLFEKVSGRDVGSGSTVTGQEIAKVAAILAESDVRSPDGISATNKDEFARMIANQMRQALESVSVKVDLSDKATENLSVNAEIKKSFSTVSSGGQ